MSAADPRRPDRALEPDAASAVDAGLSGDGSSRAAEGDANMLDSTHRVDDTIATDVSVLGLDPREDDDGLDSGDAFATEAYDSALGQDPGELNVRNPGEADLPEPTTDDGADARSR
jgi:hypothetical protein